MGKDIIGLCRKKDLTRICECKDSIASRGTTLSISCGFIIKVFESVFGQFD
jgi:hypothetical protein